jgi:gamma-glutamylputrescine oxidase
MKARPLRRGQRPWPGLIDTTRDLLPIIVKPPNQPHLQFILGIVGLPWGHFCG